jgi:hypothetical protein
MGKPVRVLTRMDRRPAPAPVPVEVDESAQDAVLYEDALFGLLFRVEHLRDGIVATLGHGRPSGALAQASELMEQIVRFAEQHCDLATEAEMAEPAARAVAFRAAIVPFRAAQQPALNQVLACLLALYEAVFAAFTVFTNRFTSSRAARGWVEVAAMFVVELKRSIDEAKETR